MPASAIGTGAKEKVREFYEGLVRQEWQQAYATLHPESQSHLSVEEFTLLAQTYRSSLGFEPEELHVQSCAEKEAEAIAHVVLTGHIESRQRRYKDAVVLRRSDDGWRITLQDHFGRIAR
jgi:hypothetical protein